MKANSSSSSSTSSMPSAFTSMDVVPPASNDAAFNAGAHAAPGPSGDTSEMVAAGAKGTVKAKKSAKSRKDAPKKSKSSSYTRRTINVSGSVIRQMDTCISEKPMAMLANIASDTSDPDPTSQSPMNDSRHTFLEMCQYRHYQFDTLRRAKHSSMMVLYHLQHPLLQVHSTTVCRVRKCYRRCALALQRRLCRLRHLPDLLRRS